MELRLQLSYYACFGHVTRHVMCRPSRPSTTLAAKAVPGLTRVSKSVELFEGCGVARQICWQSSMMVLVEHGFVLCGRPLSQSGDGGR